MSPGELAAPASGVEDQQRVGGQGQRGHSSQVGQPGLLGPGDHLDTDAAPGEDLVDEDLPVGGLSQASGAHGGDVDRTVATSLLDQLGDGVCGTPHRGVGELPGLRQSLAEAGHHGGLGLDVRNAVPAITADKLDRVGPDLEPRERVGPHPSSVLSPFATHVLCSPSRPMRAPRVEHQRRVGSLDGRRW